jgi:type II secretory pathway pseudopilin PulG
MHAGLPSPPSAPFASRFTFHVSRFTHHVSRITLHAPRSTHHPRIAAFTLIELIGVLAVIAILVAMSVPVVIRQMDQAARTKEASDLNAISNAIVLQVVGTNGTKRIPSQADWAQTVANWTQFPVSKISTNNRRYARAFLIDDSGWFGTAAGALPYPQTNTGSAIAPTNARVMVIGTIAGALPVSSGMPGSAVFDAIWNTPANTKPSTGTNWPKGEDLFIQRLNVGQLFHHLVVVNRDDPTAPAPMFTIDTTNTLTVTNGGGGRSAYYLDGSVVGLCDSTGTPIMRFVLTRDSGFVFEGGAWHTQITGGDSNEVMANNFAELAAKFLAAQWYPGAHQAGRGDQQGALIGMFNLMLVFSMWADQYPHFPRHGANQQSVPEFVLLNDLVNSSTPGGGTSGLLDKFTVQLLQ